MLRTDAHEHPTGNIPLFPALPFSYLLFLPLFPSIFFSSAPLGLPDFSGLGKIGHLGARHPLLRSWGTPCCGLLMRAGAQARSARWVREPAGITRILEKPQAVVLQGMKFLLNIVREEENLRIPHCLVQDSLNFTLKHLLPVPAGDKVQHQLDHSFDPVR